jgi:hypothetical protein
MSLRNTSTPQSLGVFGKLRKANISFVMSVCPPARMEQLDPHAVDFHEIWYLIIFRKSVKKIAKFIKIWHELRVFYMKTTIHFCSYLALFFLEWEMLLYKSFRKSQNTPFLFKNFIFENRAVYEIMWKNTVEPGRPHITIWRMRIACWIPTATNAQSEYPILISFPL